MPFPPDVAPLQFPPIFFLSPLPFSTEDVKAVLNFPCPLTQASYIPLPDC